MSSADWRIPDSWPIAKSDTPWEEMAPAFAELGDGLPLVAPTRRRMEAMLSGVASPNRILGHLPPLLGELNAASVAYNCVIAGCRPAELAIVITALVCCLEPTFNLLGIQTTTGSATVAVIVHGPASAQMMMNSGGNCLGPGNRANACIGRAVRLALTNIGGACPGVGDMATLGQPGKYGFCFADTGHTPAFPALHVQRGLKPSASAVTVFAPSGTVEVLPWADGDTPDAIVAPLALAMRSARLAAAGFLRNVAEEQIFILPPELAESLARRGYDATRLKEHILKSLRQLPADLLAGFGADADGFATAPRSVHPIVAGGAGVKMAYLPVWGGGSISVTRELGVF